ncbi:hypothetical protein Trydic_g16248 [Trypoxylus dichotomus]
MSFSVLCLSLIVSVIKLVEGNLTGKIVSGFTCHPRDYPFLASIKTINSGIFCGGSVINKYWILTAGHCCANSRKAQLIVYTGLTEAKAYVQRRIVKKKVVHPEFSLLPLSSDLCLLKTYQPIRENPYTRYVKLADEIFYARVASSRLCNYSIALGFGKQNIIHKNHTEEPIMHNQKLQCVHQRLMSHEFCSWNVLVDRTMLCTLGTATESADVCKGDSGGPLICQGVQIGIVSAGRGCGIGLPSYFTRIDSFYDFIVKHSSGIISDLSVFIFVEKFFSTCGLKINPRKKQAIAFTRTRQKLQQKIAIARTEIEWGIPKE